MVCLAEVWVSLAAMQSWNVNNLRTRNSHPKRTEFACTFMLLLGCGTDAQTPAEPGPEAPVILADTDGDGIFDATETILGTNPDSPSSVCVTESWQAGLQTRPVDIIFVIDNSGSMREEIAAIRANINTNFAQVMENAGVDYRVIVISSHGEGNAFDADICVEAPLSGTQCNPVPDAPANSERLFHYDTRIGSDDSLRRVLGTYSQSDPHGLAPGGWGGWLRENAFKVFIEFTDDDSSMSALAFDEALLALAGSPFGTAGSRNYVFHSVVGLSPKETAAPYVPGEPLQPFVCGTAENNGEEYQRLSLVTGGLRYPVCDAESYNAIFNAAALEIVEVSSIACSLPFLSPPEGFRIDDSRLAFELRLPTSEFTISRVDSASSCTEHAFYLSDFGMELCPQTCSLIKAAQSGELRALAECDVQTCDSPTPEVCNDGIDNDCNGFTDTQDLNCFL